MEKFFRRLSEKRLEEYLEIFGAVCLVGPRFVGKTTVGKFYAKNVFDLSDANDLLLAQTAPGKLFEKTQGFPIMIDEWQIIPNLWPMVKSFVDSSSEHGLFILTGSIWLGKRIVSDPGIGRFGFVEIRPLSIYEANDSCNLISLLDLVTKNQFSASKINDSWLLDNLIEITCRGGFPQAVLFPNHAEKINAVYIDNIIRFLINSGDSFRKSLFTPILKQCALNNGQVLNFEKMSSQLETFGKKISRLSWTKYFDLFRSLFIVELLPSFDTNIFSKKQIVQKPKMYFCDPAIPIAFLEQTPALLLKNLNSFGFYFENLVYRDLKNYADYYNAKLFYYRDSSGLEVDFILQFSDGTYAAIEVKLSNLATVIDAAISNLIKFKKSCYKAMEKAKTIHSTWNLNRDWVPNKLIVLTGIGSLAYEKNIDGESVYVIPIQMLKP